MLMEPQPNVGYVRAAQLIKVIDGDSLRCNVDLGFTVNVVRDIRLAGCDTPEVRGSEAAAGKFVAEQLKSFIGDETELIIDSVDFAVGKYGRCLAKVWVHGACLNYWLLATGYAWRTDSSGRVANRSIETLDLPEGIKQQVRERQL